MKRILYTLSSVGLLLWGGKLQAQLVVTSGATLNILSGETVTLVGTNLQNNLGGGINHNGTLKIMGNATDRDIINSGAFNGANGTIEMLGVDEQQIQGEAPVHIGTFVVDNNGHGVSVNQAFGGGLYINNNLNLVNGKLFTSNLSPVFFESTASNPNETNTNHIVGTAIMNLRTVGTSNLNFLMLNITGSDDVGMMSIVRRTGNGTPTSRGFVPTSGVANVGSSQSIAAHWLVETSLSVGSRNITFSWFNAWNNSKNSNQMQLWDTQPSDINTNWFLYNAGPLSTPANPLNIHSHTENNVPLNKLSVSLGRAWTLSDFVNPLPVDMFAFSVRVVKGKDVEVAWTTQNEHNIRGYTVERSVDNIHFEPLVSVSAKNQAENKYLHTDFNAKDLEKEVLYYRIAMIETNGQVRYSPAKAAHFNKEFWVSLYPNPFRDNFSLKIYNPEQKSITVTLIDNLGRIHLKAQLTGEEIHYQPTERLDYLSAGTYLLQVSTGSQVEIVKLVKN